MLKKAIYSWLSWLVVALYFGYEMFQLALLNTLGQEIMLSLTLGTAQLSWLSSAYLLACALTVIPAGLLLDRWPMKPLLLVTLACCVIGVGLMAYTQSLGGILLGRAMTGIGNGFSFLAALKLTSAVFTQKTASVAKGLIYTLGLSGCLLAQTPFAWLSQQTSWQYAQKINVLLGIVLWLMLAISLKEPRKSYFKDAGNFWNKLRLAAWNWQNQVCGVFASIANLPLIIFGALWGSDYLQQNYGLSPVAASDKCSLIFLGMILGAPLIGRLAPMMKSLDAFMIITSLLAAAMVGIMAIIHLPLPIISVIFFTLGLCCCGQLLSYFWVSEHNLTGMEATASSIVTVSVNGLGAVWQWLYGVLVDTYTVKSELPLLGLSGLFLLSTFFAYRLRVFKKPTVHL